MCHAKAAHRVAMAAQEETKAALQVCARGNVRVWVRVRMRVRDSIRQDTTRQDMARDDKPTQEKTRAHNRTQHNTAQ